MKENKNVSPDQDGEQMNDDKATSQSLQDELMKPADIREKDPAKSSPQEIIVPVPEQNSNIEHQTALMEVHHHGHVHEKKKWKEYLFQFLMLFLAVFCGFLAEYQLEHKIEKDRAKEYAESLLGDLKKDTISLNSHLKEIDFVAPKIDTFRTLAQTKKINNLPGGTWYYYARFTSFYFSFSANDATIEQLKSSGSLRYFKKSEIINAIAQYDKVCRSIKELYNYEQPIINKMIELRNKIFIAANFDSVMKFNTSRGKIDSFMQKEIKFLDSNPATLIELANFCQTSVVDSYYRRLKYQDALKLATDLISLLKKEYHLK